MEYREQILLSLLLLLLRLPCASPPLFEELLVAQLLRCVLLTVQHPEAENRGIIS